MKIRIRAVPFDKLQTTTPDWKISIGARKPYDKTVVVYFQVDTNDGGLGRAIAANGSLERP